MHIERLIDEHTDSVGISKIDMMLEVTDAEGCLEWSVSDINELLEKTVLEDKEREMWEHAKKYLIDVEAKEKLKI
jgi:hypothetical protein